MKNIWLVAVCLSIVLVCSFHPGPARAGSGYGTGDTELDETLGKIDRAARDGVGDVARRIGRENGLPPEMVDWMLNKVGMSPGDAYMAAKVASVSRRSVEDVVAVYNRNRGKGWGAIAKQMGIKPGSAEFHALKADGDDFSESGKKRGKGKGKGRAKKKGKGKKW
jgi:hypothetical protein